MSLRNWLVRYLSLAALATAPLSCSGDEQLVKDPKPKVEDPLIEEPLEAEKSYLEWKPDNAAARLGINEMQLCAANKKDECVELDKITRGESLEVRVDFEFASSDVREIRRRVIIYNKESPRQTRSIEVLTEIDPFTSSSSHQLVLPIEIKQEGRYIPGKSEIEIRIEIPRLVKEVSERKAIEIIKEDDLKLDNVNFCTKLTENDRCENPQDNFAEKVRRIYFTLDTKHKSTEIDKLIKEGSFQINSKYKVLDPNGEVVAEGDLESDESSPLHLWGSFKVGMKTPLGKYKVVTDVSNPETALGSKDVFAFGRTGLRVKIETCHNNQSPHCYSDEKTAYFELGKTTFLASNVEVESYTGDDHQVSISYKPRCIGKGDKFHEESDTLHISGGDTKTNRGFVIHYNLEDRMPGLINKTIIIPHTCTFTIKASNGKDNTKKKDKIKIKPGWATMYFKAPIFGNISGEIIKDGLSVLNFNSGWYVKNRNENLTEYEQNGLEKYINTSGEYTIRFKNIESKGQRGACTWRGQINKGKKVRFDFVNFGIYGPQDRKSYPRGCIPR